MSEVDELRQTLARIAEMARSASNGTSVEGEHNGSNGHDLPAADVPGCTVKTLPRRLLVKAAATAVKINPVNAPVAAPMGAAADLGVMDPLRLSVLTAKYWGPTPRRLTVSFMESTPPDLRARIVSHMNAWTRTACISFVETRGVGQVRISRAGSGYWSYLGTDIFLIPRNRPTMNLQGFTMNTPESEYRRVVRHETGHTMGFPHEHMRKSLIARIDSKKAYQWFLQTQGWDKATVDAQVLTPLDDRSLMSTPADQTSIMCYQLPASITKDGMPIAGGLNINATDYEFAGRIYPKPGSAPAAAERNEDSSEDEEWAESEDVEVGA
jgi:Astacin (Peptidase family M12A)